MAHYQTCVDIGKQCEYVVRKTSCADCGRVASSRFYTPLKCTCEPETPPTSSHISDVKQDTKSKSGSLVKKGKRGTHECRQTNLQWLFSFIGFGKTACNEGCANQLKTETSAAKSESPRGNALEKARELCAENKKKQERIDKGEESPPLSPVNEEDSEVHEQVSEDGAIVKSGIKPKNRSSSRSRSRSPGSKSRTKRPGRTLESSGSPRKRSISPISSRRAATRSNDTSNPPSPTQRRLRTSPISSSVRYLVPYNPIGSESEREDSPEGSRRSRKVRKDPPSRPLSGRPNRSMSCPPPASLCPTCPEPCWDPSITSLMRRRCPAPNVGNKKSRSFNSSPSRVNEGIKRMRKSPTKTQTKSPAASQISKKVPANKTVKPKSAPYGKRTPADRDKCSSPSYTGVRPRNNDNPGVTVPRAPNGCGGECPITCMRPCCVPAVNYQDCPPNKSAGASSAKSPKKCGCTKLNSDSFPVSTSIICSRDTMRSYARSKDNDAYCKYLMARYNVTAPEYPPPCPMSLATCPTSYPSSYKAPKDIAMPKSCPASPCKAGTTKEKAATNCTQNYKYDKKALSPEYTSGKGPVAYNDSPSKKEPLRAIQLKRTPVECIRETGPRSPTRDYLSKIGLPNKETSAVSPPSKKPTGEIVSPEQIATEEQSSPKSDTKSPKKRKAKPKQPKKKMATEEDATEADELARQNKSDNKAFSDARFKPAKSKPNKPVYSASKSPEKTCKLQRAKGAMTSSKTLDRTTLPDHDQSRACNRYSSRTSSFYHKFLGLSPRTRDIRNALTTINFPEYARAPQSPGSKHSPTAYYRNPASPRNTLASLINRQSELNHKVTNLTPPKRTKSNGSIRLSVPSHIIPKTSTSPKRSSAAFLDTTFKKSKSFMGSLRSSPSKHKSPSSLMLGSESASPSKIQRSPWAKQNNKDPQRFESYLRPARPIEHDGQDGHLAKASRETTPCSRCGSPRRTRSLSPNERRRSVSAGRTATNQPGDQTPSVHNKPTSKKHNGSPQLWQDEIDYNQENSGDSVSIDKQTMSHAMPISSQKQDFRDSDRLTVIDELLSPEPDEENSTKVTQIRKPSGQDTYIIPDLPTEEAQYYSSCVDGERFTSSVDISEAVVALSHYRESSVDPCDHESCVDPAGFYSEEFTAHRVREESGVDLLEPPLQTISMHRVRGESEADLTEASDGTISIHQVRGESGVDLTEAPFGAIISMHRPHGESGVDLIEQPQATSIYRVRGESGVDLMDPPPKTTSIYRGESGVDLVDQPFQTMSMYHARGESGVDLKKPPANNPEHGKKVSENKSPSVGEAIDKSRNCNDDHTNSSCSQDGPAIDYSDIPKAAEPTPLNNSYSVVPNTNLENSACAPGGSASPLNTSPCEDEVREPGAKSNGDGVGRIELHSPSDENTHQCSSRATPVSASSDTSGATAFKQSQLHQLLSSSAINWSKVGPVTDTEIKILRLAKASFNSLNSDKMSHKNDKPGGSNPVPPKPFLGLLKPSEDTGEEPPLSTELLKPEDDTGKSILSRLKDL